MDPIDKLLSNLDAEEPKPSAPPKPSADASTRSIDDLLGDLNTRPQSPTVPQPRSEPVAPQPAPNLLETMRAEHEQQQAEAKLEQQRQAQQKQRRLEQLKQQRRAELTEKATQWLRELDPKSSEGRWFEEFSCNYESRLEAAIDYLEALHDVNPNP